MSHKQIGFAIVGYGLAAKLHAQALIQLDEAIEHSIKVSKLLREINKER